MRWNEIVMEEAGVMAQAKDFILDIIVPLKSQGVDSITVQQVIDQLAANPDFEGTRIDAEFVSKAISGTNDLKIDINPETSKQTIFIDNPSPGRTVDNQQAQKDAKRIRGAALRALNKKAEK